LDEVKFSFVIEFSRSVSLKGDGEIEEVEAMFVT
jgi:hypothetical protein